MAGLIAAVASVVAAALAGQDLAGPALYAISGRVESARGGPPAGLILMVYSATPYGVDGTSCELGPDGRFTARDLSPGTYILEAAPPEEPEGRPAGFERGFSVVTVRDGDVRDVVVATAPGATVRGRIRFDESQPGAPRPETIVVHAGLALTEWMGPSETAVVAPDGTFVLHDVRGPRIFRTGGMGQLRRWWSPGPVLLDGRDITNEPLDATHEPVGEILIVFTQAPSTILGRVEDVAGLTTPGACVVLLPEERDLQRGWSTAVGTTQADRRGQFYFTGLPHGEYVVAAFDGRACPSRPEVIGQARELARRATHVQVGEGKVAHVVVTAATTRPRP